MWFQAEACLTNGPGHAHADPACSCDPILGQLRAAYMNLMGQPGPLDAAFCITELNHCDPQRPNDPKPPR